MQHLANQEKKKNTKNKVSFKWALKNIVWPRRNQLLVGLLFIVIGRIASLVSPIAIKRLIDDAVPNKDSDLLILIVLAVISAIIIQSLASYLLTKLLSIQAHKMIYDLRIQVQKKILSLPINYFDNHKSGGLVSRIMTDVEGIRNLVGTGFVQLFGGSFTIIIAMGYLINMNWKLTAFVFLPVILFGFVAMKAFGVLRPIFRKRGKINSDVTGRLTETLNGIRVIKGFNAEEQEQQVFEKGAFELFSNVKKTLTTQALITSAGTVLLGIATAGIMWIGGFMMINESLTTGEFFSFNVMSALMLAPIFQMSNIGSQLTEALAGLDRTQEIMEMKSEDDSEERSIVLDEIKGDLAFNNVSFCYDEDTEVLHNIDIHAPAGTVTALVGSSGSGKSTIAGHVATFLMATSGTVTIDGHDMKKIKLNSYRKDLGLVLQDDFLFEGTIRENILFAKPDATEEQIKNAVTGAYVNEFTDKFELGLETVIGERGVKLSGGQKQRVSIARALISNPKVIILDEATSNLDTESERYIQKSLDLLMKNRTTVVIAHRLSTIKQADQILVVEGGKIAERGKHDELIAKEGRYFELYNYQSRI